MGMSTAGGFVFGGVFVAVGSLIMLVGAKIIPVESGSVHAPYSVLMIAGSVFALAGLMVSGMAIKQFAANKRHREMAGRYGNEPALADYPWDVRGFGAPRWKRAINCILGAGVFTLFLSMFNWWAFFAKGPWLVKAVVVIFDLILLAIWYQAVVYVGRAVKFGGSCIEFAHFPYSRTQPIVVRWQRASGIERINQGTFTLRCVEEWLEQRGSGKNRSIQVIHEERWSGTWRVDRPQTFEFGQWIELKFDLPPNPAPTRLSAERPLFWEFEVHLDLPGLDFNETYLVPIY